MSELVEVVFEDVPKDKVTQLVMELVIDSEKIVNVQRGESLKCIDDCGINLSVLDSWLYTSGDAVFVFNLTNMKMGSILLPVVLMRLVKYGEFFDVDFNIDLEQVDGVSIEKLVGELHHYSKKLASNYNVNDFFCGMEPASDEDTRYFTNERLGPL